MENDQQINDQAKGALLAGDHWLRQNGIISDFTINTIMAYIHINYPKTQNIELDVDRNTQVLHVRIYFKFWNLVWLMLTGRSQAVVDDIFTWLSEYLPVYQVSVELLRYRPTEHEKFNAVSARSRNPDISTEDLRKPEDSPT